MMAKFSKLRCFCRFEVTPIIHRENSQVHWIFNFAIFTGTINVTPRGALPEKENTRCWDIPLSQANKWMKEFNGRWTYNNR